MVANSGAAGAGAGAAKGAAAAAGTAAGTAVGGVQGWWKGLWTAHGPAVEQRIQGAVKAVSKAKLAMPVDVKVDFLRPTIETIQQSFQSAWAQLPPPVQQAAPYAGVALGSGLVVYAIQQRRLNNQVNRNRELQLELNGLQKERLDLLRRVNTLKANRAPRTEVEARLANAVAEATNAAAAAADAAARAATACIIQRP
ncbi:mTERF domain-containing mitochondrial [Chlorella sorokiniana]|uniref:mTERF domain-containing mitochondrial n=1 Tax=Chlorella sorokiniana TaxID=3076 RepID=A0A2P6U5C2_CHLSO|nr:mTERF domain-containing mitochondrial [Chlorella sorokiniana]|eukprot:PRW61497.1 mTERF domain-containing mitochondrial [Chlorella sorokiniana]